LRAVFPKDEVESAIAKDEIIQSLGSTVDVWLRVFQTSYRRSIRKEQPKWSC
jgi:hypothetical protein